MGLPVPLRVLITVVYFACILYSSAVFMIPVFTLFIVVSCLSQNAWLKLACFIQASYLALFQFFFEDVMGVRVRVTGDFLKAEPAVIFGNHLSHDWIPLYILTTWAGSVGALRAVVKDSVALVPGLGWAMWCFYWPFVSRDYAKDAPYLRKLFLCFGRNKLPVQLAIFPEGTRLVPKKLKSSQEYQRQQGYPVWNHVLLPRHRGFIIAMQSLRDVADSVFDMTLAYDGWGNPAPSFGDLLRTDPRSGKYSIHVDFQRFAFRDIPDTDEGKKQWLMERWARKERMLADFETEHAFPGTVVQRPPVNRVLHVLAWTGMSALTVVALHRYLTV